MFGLQSIVAGLRTLFWKKQVEQEMDEELRGYLDAAVKDKMRSGMSYKQALRAARVELGSMDAVKEEIRSAGWEAIVESLWQDLRYGLRQLRRSPGLTTVIVLSLALGIGANTAVFTLMDAVMLKMLPVKDPQRLVLLGWVNQCKSFDIWTSGYGIPGPQGREGRASFAYPLIEQLRAQGNAFSSVFGFVPTGLSKESLTVSTDGQTSMTDAVMVTGGYFSGLGIVPVIGRLITDADVRENAPRVAVISYSYWTRRFARAPAAVGKAIFLNGVPFTIVGVAPPEFFGVQPGHAPDVWVPLVREERLAPWGNSSRAGEMWTRPDWWWVMIMARLKPGVSEQEALAAANGPFFGSARAAAKGDLKSAEAPTLVCLPASRGLDNLRRGFSRQLWLLTVVAGLVLLIACANIATLLLARAAARQREIGVRLAVGATRGRLIRQLLTESVFLSGIGGVIGLILAQWGSRVLLILMMGSAQTLDLGARPDLAVAGFCAGISLLTGILFGLAPAIRATQADVTPNLKKPASGFATMGSRFSLGKALVIVQVALSLVLLVGAGLLARTLSNLDNQNLGFNHRNLLLFAIDPSKSGYKGQRILSLCDNICKRLQAVHGVQAVTSSELALLTGWMNNGPIVIEGSQPKSGQDTPVEWDAVGAGFFDTMGIRVLLGRPIERRDAPSSSKVAVVNEALARYYFGDGNPIGRRFSFGDKFDPTSAHEIVGVVENAKYESLRTTPRMVYVPIAQQESGFLGRTYFEVRTAGDPKAFISAVRNTIREIDPSLGLEGMKTQTQQIKETLTQERLLAELSSFFGVLALGLAAVGLYGLMAYSVAQRTHEFGIRMALGAQRKQVLFMILQQSLRLVVVGVVGGLVAAIATTRLIASELYGLKPTDPLTFGFAAFFMLAVAALAAYFPARRATKVDPLVALRYE